MKFPTRKSFTEWLKAKDSNAVVGTAYSCPLTTYLKDKGYALPEVCPDVNGGYWIIGNAESSDLPRWANSFGIILDQHFSKETNRDVQVSKALAILRGI